MRTFIKHTNRKIWQHWHQYYNATNTPKNTKKKHRDRATNKDVKASMEDGRDSLYKPLPVHPRSDVADRAGGPKAQPFPLLQASVELVLASRASVHRRSEFGQLLHHRSPDHHITKCFDKQFRTCQTPIKSSSNMKKKKKRIVAPTQCLGCRRWRGRWLPGDSKHRRQRSPSPTELHSNLLRALTCQYMYLYLILSLFLSGPKFWLCKGWALVFLISWRPIVFSIWWLLRLVLWIYLWFGWMFVLGLFGCPKIIWKKYKI